MADGLPVTTPLRTIIDLAAAQVDGEHLAGVVRDTVTTLHLDPDVVAEALRPYAHRYGAPLGEGQGLLTDLLQRAGVPKATRTVTDLVRAAAIPPAASAELLRAITAAIPPAAIAELLRTVTATQPSIGAEEVSAGQARATEVPAATGAGKTATQSPEHREDRDSLESGPENLDART